MFARYDYKAGSLPVNVASDIIKLLTGTTDLTTLSGDCVQATSYIISDASRPAGWEVYDAAVDANGTQALRALNADGTTYKYIAVGGVAGGFFTKVYESWNAATHVGTNEVWGSTAQHVLNYSSGGVIFISASARCIIAQPWSSTGFNSAPAAVIEHTREEPWDTAAFGLPPYGFASTSFFTSSGRNFRKPRRKNGEADLVGNTSEIGYYGTVPYSNTYSGTNIAEGSPSKKVRDASYGLVHAFCKILLSDAAYSTAYEPNIPGYLYDIYATTRGNGAIGDEVVFEGKTYFIMGETAGSNCRIAVPKF